MEIRDNKLLSTWEAAVSLQLATAAFAQDMQEVLADKGGQADIVEDADDVYHDDNMDQEAHYKLIEQCKPWLQILLRNIREYINPPGALGSGHRGLAHKAGTFVYALHLQTAAHVPLQQQADSYQSHTADMGIELGFPNLHLSDRGIDGLLPDWIERMSPDVVCHVNGPAALAVEKESDGELQVDGIDGAIVPHSDDEEQLAAIEPPPLPVACTPAPPVLMDNALQIAGLQHISDNLCEDVHLAMDYWPQFFAYLKLLEALLTVQERRFLYINQCLRGTPYQHYERKFLKFKGSLHEERWREVLFFLKRIITLLPCLCATWDHVKYEAGADAVTLNRGAQAKAQARQEHRAGVQSFSPRILTVALQSGLFTRFCFMAVKLEDVPPAFAAWAEQCPCHAPLLDLCKTDYKKRLLFQQHYGPSITKCPCSGMRLSELIAGKLDEVAEKAWENAEAEIMCLPTLRGVRAMSEDDWVTLLRNYRHGRNVQRSLLALKTDYNKRLPTFLAGLAHVDEDVARSIGHRIVEAFSVDPRAAVHHRKT